MKPKWIESQRVERVRRFSLAGRPRDVFPLLCPVREYEWIPSWSCVMAYSESGVAELDAVFQTVGPLRKKIVWTLITFEPDQLVEYLMVAGRDMVVRLSIWLANGASESTDITWRMLFTAMSLPGKTILARHFSEEKFAAMLELREKELRHFLATGTMLFPTAAQGNDVPRNGGSHGEGHRYLDGAQALRPSEPLPCPAALDRSVNGWTKPGPGSASRKQRNALRRLDYWKAEGLAILCWILFKGMRLGGDNSSKSADRRRRRQLRGYMMEGQAGSEDAPADSPGARA